MEYLRARFRDVHNSSSVRDLDPVRSFTDHGTRISRTNLYHLRQLRTIRHSLSPHTVTTVVHALICIRVDFGYSIGAGLSSLNFSRLQSILSAATRLIGGLPARFCPHTCLHCGHSSLTSCVTAHPDHKFNSYAQLFGLGSSLISQNLRQPELC